MTETLLLLLFSVGMGLYHDESKPIEYALNMEDGSNAHVILQKNSKYACPLHCGVDHVHHAIMYENDNNSKEHQMVYHISRVEGDGFAVYCSFKKILSMNKMTSKNAQKNIPDIVSASKEE